MTSPTSSALTFVAALAGLNAREERAGLRPLAEQDIPWEQRVEEVYVLLRRAVGGDGTPDPRLIAKAGAHLVALDMAVLEASVVRVETGEAA